MIRLDVQDYCQNCSEFEADAENPKRLFAGLRTIEITDTIVRCKNRKKCENIKLCLEKKVNEHEQTKG